MEALQDTKKIENILYPNSCLLEVEGKISKLEKDCVIKVFGFPSKSNLRNFVEEINRFMDDYLGGTYNQTTSEQNLTYTIIRR